MKKSLILKKLIKNISKGRKSKVNLILGLICSGNILRKVKTKLFNIIILFINKSIPSIENESQKIFPNKKFHKPFTTKIPKKILSMN